MHSLGEAPRPQSFKPVLVRDADAVPIRLTVDGSVQSASARALLVLYRSLANGALPARSAFRPSDLAPYQNGLAIVELVPGQDDFIIRSWGPEFVNVYGDMAGQRLSALESAAARDRAMAGLELALSSERPVVASAPIGSLAGHLMLAECLVLPMTGPGGAGRLALVHLTIRPETGPAKTLGARSGYQSFP